MSRGAVWLQSSIRRRMVVLALLPAALVAVLLSAYFLYSRYHDLESHIHERGQAIVNHLAPAFEYGVFSGNVAEMQNLAQAALREPDVVAISVLYANGEAMIELQRPDVAETSRPEWVSFRAPIYAQLQPLSDLGTLPHEASGDLIGWLRIQLSTAELRTREQRMLLDSAAIIGAGLILTLWFSVRLSRHLSDPLERLTRAVEQLRRGNLQARVRATSAGELGRLEHGINAMAAALGKTQQELEERVSQATAELRETLEAVEVQNVELDLARKRALEASRVKSSFLANVSHELRTPLHALLGFSDMLLAGQLTAEQRESVRIIHSAAENLLRMVEDILDFSRLESGKLSFIDAPFDLRSVAEESLELMAPRAHAKGLELALLYYHDVPPLVVGDANRVRQVLLNLIGNAVKFTNQGEVTVRVMLEEQGLSEPGVCISVSDSGIGLSEEEREQLFLAFTQIVRPGANKQEGTGLGLAISKHLVEAMGGEIGVDSSPGLGSTFWFSLPLAPARQLAPQGEPPAADRTTAVVLAEARILRLALAHQLEALGLDTVVAEDEEEALALLQRPSLGLLVWAPGAPEPGDDPPQLVREVHRLQPAPRILVLVPSYEQGLHKAWQSLGVELCLGRPARSEVLRRALLGPTAEASPPPAIAAATPTAPALPRPGGVRVLVAEDNELNRSLALRQLRVLGAQATPAEDGDAALRLARETRYDLILMDLNMPGHRGDEVARILRAGEGPNRRTPILAMTANALPEALEECLAAGMDAYLIKPVSGDTLARALHEWTHQGPAGATEGLESPALMEELAQMFRGQVHKHLETLQPARQAEDWEAVASEAHRLAGSAACCRRETLQAAAIALENAVRDGAGPEHLRSSTDALLDLLREEPGADDAGLQRPDRGAHQA